MRSTNLQPSHRARYIPGDGTAEDPRTFMPVPWFS
jgi:hypothetical protein